MTPQDEELFAAAREGRHEEVGRLVRGGADPNAVDPRDPDHGSFMVGLTPVMVAAGSPRSNRETLQALLKHGASVQKRSNGGVSAVWYASGGLGFDLETCDWELGEDHPFRDWGGGDVERLRVLLDAGGDPNETADNGRSCIVEACGAGDPERLALLIERGASLAVEKRGLQSFAVPLFEAAESGSAPCVRLLLERGFPADFSVGGENALHFAKTVEVAELLWNAGVRVKRGRWSDPVDEAFEKERHGLAEFLLSKLREGTEFQKYLNAKLMRFAGVSMNPEAVRMLLRLGAEVNHIDSGLGTPLHYACWQGDGNMGRADETTREAVELLIEGGADVNCLLPRRGTPLHEAVTGDWESPTSTQVLLQRGAAVDAIDQEGRTPLMAAADRGSLECARLLLAAGADSALKDRRGKRAKDYAHEHLKTWRSLAKAGSIVNAFSRLKELKDYEVEALEEAEALYGLFEER